jgi:arabinofuranan 3-O-arabinosyltransferase
MPRIDLSGPVPPVVRRLRIATICAVLTLIAFAQEPGKLSRDTKLDLYVAPAEFLGRALHAWDPTRAFGGMQNQAYGYLFPMGPFYALAHGAGVPMWVAQRAWMALLLCVAFLGMLRLCTALGVGGPVTRVVAALAFALSPRVATTLGPLSSEILPLCVAPWALLPLVRPTGRGGVRGTAARSALAILCAGGVNAVATLAVCIPPALWLLTRRRSREHLRLTGWWVAAVSAACLWWAVPLLVLGRYSFPFLDYIETSTVTTGGTSLPEILRGTSHWLGGLVAEGGPWWRGGWTVKTNSLVVLYSLVLAGLGIWGLASHRLRERAFLVACLFAGCLIVGFGYAGSGGPLFGGAERALLDGVLAPFRNVHKFDLVLRVPLAVGLCHALSVVGLPAVRGLRRGMGVLAVAVVATPFVFGQIVPSGAYTSVPAYWSDAARWLSSHGPTHRALLLPASSFGEYKWGRPMDEPMGPLMTTPWAVRDQIPLGAEGSIRVMDAVEERIAAGTGSPGLAVYLGRAGVRFVVVRNDLDWPRLGATQPALVHQALARSGGFRLAASFGPGVAAVPPGSQQVGDHGRDTLYRAVEIFEVTGAPSLVQSYPAGDVVGVTGGPESLLPADDHALVLGKATVLDGDPQAQAVTPARVLVGDGMRKREVNFGAASENASATLAPGERTVQDRRATDYLPFPGIARTSATYPGVAAVRASSSAADPTAFRIRGREYHPGAAVDGNRDSVWISGAGRAVGQWWEARLARPTAVPGIEVDVLDTSLFGGTPSLLRIATSSGSFTVSVTGDGRPIRVNLGQTRTSFVRLTVAALTEGSDPEGLVGLREVRLAGVDTTRRIAAARSSPGGDRPTAVVLAREPGARTACVQTPGYHACGPQAARLGEEEGPFAREFTTVGGGPADLAVTLTPRPGTALTTALLRSLLPAGVTVSVSSSLVPETAAGAVSLLDGDRSTVWLASHADTAPYVDVRWTGRREVDRVLVQTTAVAGASRPTSILVTARGETRHATITPAGVASFPALTTDRLRITFPDPAPVLTVDPRFGQQAFMPLGLASLTVPAVWETEAGPRVVTVPCGGAPTVELDGTPLRTAVTADLRAVVRGEAVAATVCDAVPATSAGRHVLSAPDTGAWRVQGALLRPRAWEPAEPTAHRGVSVVDWSATHRTLRVAAGGETLLAVAENANAGWHATLEGQDLTPVRLDGWRQGWLLPAGAGGDVVLDYGPQGAYAVGLVGGALAVLLLLVAAVRPVRRARIVAPPAPAGVTRTWLVVAAATPVLAGGLWGLAAVALTLGVVAGARRWDRFDAAAVVRTALAAALVALAVAATGAVQGWLPWAPYTGLPSQLVALAALALLAAAAGLSRSRGAAAGASRS